MTATYSWQERSWMVQPDRTLQRPIEVTTQAGPSPLDSTPGTYVLLLALQVPAELQVGRLGAIQFDSPFYLYFGSAFGPGGLKARIRHHLQPVRSAHWHIDYLRQEADVIGIWYSSDRARLECIWANAALAHRGVSPVPRFGSSDCGCHSHLLAANRLPTLRAFRRRIKDVRPGCARIQNFRTHVLSRTSL